MAVGRADDESMLVTWAIFCGTKAKREPLVFAQLNHAALTTTVRADGGALVSSGDFEVMGSEKPEKFTFSIFPKDKKKKTKKERVDTHVLLDYARHCTRRSDLCVHRSSTASLKRIRSHRKCVRVCEPRRENREKS